MTEIIPAVMPKNLEDLMEKTGLFVGVVPLIQLDLMDGVFVQERTWPYDYHGEEQIVQMTHGGGLPHWKEIGFELDLMIDRPERTLERWLALSPKRLIFHIESTDRMASVLEMLAKYHGYVEVGLALDTATPNEMLIPYLEARSAEGNPLVDFVQCMGIARIGYQGEPFDDRVLGRLQQLRERYPDLVLSVDGGVGFDTAGALLAAGANRLVSGSAILKSGDVRDAITHFEAIARDVENAPRA